MRGLPKTQRGAVKRTWWTLGWGGASCLSTVAVMHGQSAPAAIAAGAVAAVVGGAVAELVSALPDIISALSAKKVARIKAKTDAKVALEAAQQRTALVNAGLDGKLDAALSLLKLEVLNAQVVAGRRLSEEILRDLLPEPRAPHEESSGLAVIPPRVPGASARHATEDAASTQPLPIDAAARRPRSSGEGEPLIS